MDEICTYTHVYIRTNIRNVKRYGAYNKYKTVKKPTQAKRNTQNEYNKKKKEHDPPITQFL